MARRRIPLGTFGAIRCYKTEDGRYKARGRFHELSGEYSSPSAIADTPAEAEELLRARKAVRPYGMVSIHPDTSVLQASIWWLEGLRISNRVSAATLANYRGDVQHVNRALGGARLSELTVATVDAIIRALAADQPQTAIRVRKTLRLMLDEAVRVGAMRTNPVHSVRPPRVPPKEPYTLEPAQAQFLRGAYRDWLAQRKKPGPAPDPRVPAMLDVMLSVGLRIGELLALRHRDVDLTSTPPTLVVAATLVVDEKGAPKWQANPKARRQRRVLVLPDLAVAALRPYVLDSASTAPVFPNRHGAWLRPGNVRRILHNFRDEWSAQLETNGIEHNRFTPHLLRRTLATMIANEAGVDRAKEQLGHASVTTTERHYITPPRLVGEHTADLIDSMFDVLDAAEPPDDEDESARN
ncbi:tyrosine-type recombinase/integrase [Agrococcus sp. 1P02AA]|uniref:site-specific integrase n=1 Tax=Agrococcus sp. 1P02AA TaxID=3132259 RepID=UPI0039A72DEB